MKLTTFFSEAAVALAAVLMGGVLVSCSDDTFNGVEIENEVAEKGITADVFDGISSFKIKTDNNWTASIPDDCDWASLMQTSGHGNATVDIIYDANYTGITRHSEIIVESGDTKTAIKLVQNASPAGAAAENDADFIKLAGTKYLGFGCNLLEFYDDPKNNPLTYTACNVVNTTALDKLMKDDEYGEYATLANSTPIANVAYQDLHLDTLVNKHDKLSIAINIQVAYGLMKFGLTGAYSGGETMGSQVLKIKTGANYPTLESSVNYADITAAYDEWESDGKPAKDSRAFILSKNFVKVRNALKQACNAKNVDDDTVNGIVAGIIRDYGTGVVTSSKLGGMIALELDVDSAYIVEKMHLDSARITADIQMGMFSLKADLRAKYENDAISHLRNSSYRVKLLGGDVHKLDSIVQNFKTANFSSALGDDVIAWANTIANSNDSKSNTAELLEVDAKPIWVLFSDPKSAAAVKAYLQKRYPNSKFLKKFQD
jgi:hypothetical protein